jgi:hypothetical protein
MVNFNANRGFKAKGHEVANQQTSKNPQSAGTFGVFAR